MHAVYANNVQYHNTDSVFNVCKIAFFHTSDSITINELINVTNVLKTFEIEASPAPYFGIKDLKGYGVQLRKFYFYAPRSLELLQCSFDGKYKTGKLRANNVS